MKFADLIYVTVQNLRNRKSRIFFTILGVAVAIAAVFSLVAFGYGLQKSLLEKITTADSLLTFDVIPTDTNVIKLNRAMVEKIRIIPNVVKVSPEANFPSEISYHDITSGITANIVNPDFFLLQGISTQLGTFFSGSDVKKIVISSVVAQLLNLKPEEALHKTVKLTIFPSSNISSSEPEVIDTQSASQVYLGDDYQIIGIIEGQGNSGEIYINSSDSAGIPIDEYKVVKVRVSNAESMKLVRGDLISRGLLVSALSDIVDQANKIFSIIQVALGVFGVIALVVAAIGLINTMTIALLERTNEIGVIRAIGASPQDVKLLFLGESTLIGFLGGVSGIFVGIIISESLNWIFNFASQSLQGNSVRLFAYPFWFTIFIIVLSTFVGLLAGMWPAYRAAHMNPLQALKYK
ncbi:MAG: ABC transporter permease [Candidatus Taylorbacteria bacterium]|nr:ABC transporter permease [Candidatus Taylorbacteria bacterium]